MGSFHMNLQLCVKYTKKASVVGRYSTLPEKNSGEHDDIMEEEEDKKSCQVTSVILKPYFTTEILINDCCECEGYSLCFSH